MAKQNLMDTLLYRAIEQDRAKREQMQVMEQQAIANSVQTFSALERQASRDKIMAEVRKMETEKSLEREMYKQHMTYQTKLNQAAADRSNLEQKLAMQELIQKMRNEGAIDQIGATGDEARKTAEAKAEIDKAVKTADRTFETQRAEKAHGYTKELKGLEHEFQTAQQAARIAATSSDQAVRLAAQRRLKMADFAFQRRQLEIQQEFTEDMSHLGAIQKQELKIMDQQFQVEFEDLKEEHRKAGREDTAEAQQELVNLRQGHINNRQTVELGHKRRTAMGKNYKEIFKAYGYNEDINNFEDVQHLIPENVAPHILREAQAGFAMGRMQRMSEQNEAEANINSIIAKSSGKEADNPYQVMYKNFLEIVKGGASGILADPTLSRAKSQWVKQITGRILATAERKKWDLNAVRDMFTTLNSRDLPMDITDKANDAFIKFVEDTWYPQTHERLRREGTLAGDLTPQSFLTPRVQPGAPAIQLPGKTKAAAPTPGPTPGPKPGQAYDIKPDEVSDTFWAAMGSAKRKYMYSLMHPTDGSDPMTVEEAVRKMVSLFPSLAKSI